MYIRVNISMKDVPLDAMSDLESGPAHLPVEERQHR
jgi:hypothetical protein